MRDTCRVCGIPLEQPKRKGRKKEYCTPAHRQRAYEQRLYDKAYDAGFRAGSAP